MNVDKLLDECLFSSHRHTEEYINKLNSISVYRYNNPRFAVKYGV